MISREALQEFKKIYLKEYGIELSDAEATIRAIKLLTLVKAVFSPIPFEARQPRKKRVK